ncbi:unnamed protein product, partial [Polarella glacialis]
DVYRLWVRAQGGAKCPAALSSGVCGYWEMLAGRCLSPSLGGIDLDWLWEERPKEEVLPALRSGSHCQPPKRGLPAAEHRSSNGGSAREGHGSIRSTPVGPAALPSSEGPSRHIAPSPPAGRRPQRARPTRSVSRMTLSQANALHPYEVASWRGLDLQQKMILVKQEALEMARHRRDCGLEWGRASRARAARRAELLMQAKTPDPHDSLGGSSDEESVRTNRGRRGTVARRTSGESSTRQDEDVLSPSLSPSRPRLAVILGRRMSGSTSPTAGAFSAFATSLARLSSTKESIGCSGIKKLKSTVEERRKSLVKNTRLHRLKMVRQKDFQDFSDDERERLEKAFNIGGKTDSNSLGSAGLCAALDFLGLWSNNEQERKVLKGVIRESLLFGNVNLMDFVFQIVPKVDHRLHEVKSPKLYHQFQTWDVTSIGRLRYTQCLEALKRYLEDSLSFDSETFEEFWKEMTREFHTRFKSQSMKDGSIDFIGFQQLAAELEDLAAQYRSQTENRAARSEGIPANLEAAHFGELAKLLRIFCKQDKGDAEITISQVMSCLFTCGALPTLGRVHSIAREYFEQKEDSSVYRFFDFLKLVTHFRSEGYHFRQATFQSLFTVNNWPSNHTVNVEDVPQLMEKTGLCADCSCSVSDIAAVLEDCNQESETSFGLHKLLDMSGKVLEHLRASARQREDDVANQLGLATEHLLELRRSFSQLTNSGMVGKHEIRKIMDSNMDE